ncbi:hypothetical protein [Kribbella italica]|uniref:Uncharacterized protein n=1 Tax=Kribbella italica TaxID=1540520 RepID=A0A7W9JDT0_9ACTN|nr:hypothetical protein [Kribbella italica]MBB5840319.1 hypothetical protein [Kribbella italica]
MTIHHPPERASGNDRALPPLTASQAAHLVRLALDAAGERGLRATFDGTDALLLAPGPLLPHVRSGLVAGLGNLARIVAPEHPQRWPQLVSDHFDRLGEHLSHGPPPPPTDPVRDLVARLVPTTSLPPAWTAGTPEFLPGLLAVPATHDDGVVTLHLDPADFGMTRAEALDAALANLRRRTDQVELVDHEGAAIAVIGGSSFAASRALVLDTVLRETLHVENPPHGVLVALPARSLLLVHVVTDLSILSALAVMLGLSLRAHSTQPGPLTPWIQYVADSSWYPATTQPKDLEAIHLTPVLHALTRTLR